MYDYKKDDEQLSDGNKTGTFVAGENLSSDFKLQKGNLPQWAVDWARNRFNMDAKDVKFYVMDRQGAEDSVALASGNSVFVTSDQRNDETVIKHELTHIYQQAIGTATESNASDTSLEDEAVQVSKEEDISLAKNQTLSDRYILPREKTNVVQSFGALTIAGLVIGGILALGILPLGVWIAKKISKKIAERKEREGVYNEDRGSRIFPPPNDVLDSEGKNQNDEDGSLANSQLQGEDKGSEVCKKIKIDSDGFALIRPSQGTELTKEDTNKYKDCEKIKIDSRVKTIGENAFRDFKNLKEVKGLENVQTIKQYAFRGCENLKSIQSGKTEGETESLTGIDGLKNVVIMEYGAFEGCGSLTSIDLENSGITQIPTAAFIDCKELKNIGNLQKVTNIGISAFNGCKSLESIDIGSTKKIINQRAFAGCTSLTQINGLQNVEKIEDGVFDGCKGLTSINLGSTVKTMASRIFADCTSLTQINGLESVEAIEKKAFENCTSLKVIEGLQSVKTIEEETFADCGNFEIIKFGDSLTKICKRAFYSCTGLQTIEGLQNVSIIGAEAFSGCTSLGNIKLGNSVSKILYHTFTDCKTLNKIEGLQNVKIIGTDAFSGCKDLESIDLGGEVGGIDQRAFYNCKKLQRIMGQQKVEEMGESAFEGCESLKSIELAGSIFEIPERAFANCKNLETIKLPDNIEKIDECAFSNCEKLKEVSPKLKEGMYNINSFEGCKNLDVNKSFELDFNDYSEEVSDEKFTYQKGEFSLKLGKISKLPLFSKIKENSQNERIPVMSDINQTSIGDCWLVAALASIANCQPGIIKNIIKENPDGETVDVTLQRELFPGLFRKETYTVKKTIFYKKKANDKNFYALMSFSTENLWVQMIEKAFAAYLTRNDSSESISLNNLDGDDGGQGERNAFKVILGKEAHEKRKENCCTDVKKLFAKIKGSLEENIPLCFSNLGEVMLIDINGNEICSNHAYSLIGVEELDGKYYIKLRNPWGRYTDKDNKDENKAIMTVNLEEATKAKYCIYNLNKE